MMDTDADIDAAAEDPPVGWLALSVLGLVLAGAGVVAFVLDVFGVSGAIVAALPTLAPLLDLSLVVALLGIVLFVGAMLQWSPDIET
jgi:uncharacterized membrane protein YidH (DUF202 family)